MFTSYKSLEGSREGKGEAASTVLYSCIDYVASNQGRVSEVCQRNSLFRRGMDTVAKQHGGSRTQRLSTADCSPLVSFKILYNVYFISVNI
jgi:hypothetical protein